MTFSMNSSITPLLDSLTFGVNAVLVTDVALAWSYAIPDIHNGIL